MRLYLPGTLLKYSDCKHGSNFFDVYPKIHPTMNTKDSHHMHTLHPQNLDGVIPDSIVAIHDRWQKHTLIDGALEKKFAFYWQNKFETLDEQRFQYIVRIRLAFCASRRGAKPKGFHRQGDFQTTKGILSSNTSPVLDEAWVSLNARTTGARQRYHCIGSKARKGGGVRNT